MAPLNRSAAVGFQRAAADYERARPLYPQAVLDAVPRHAGAMIVDLAAGTGKLTRQLVQAAAASGATVIGLEPVAAMRDVLADFAPAVGAVAEALPFRSSSVDAITVAQAFHWFDAPRALAEIARVLRPGGTLLMVWNDRDERVPWVQAVSALIHAYDDGTSYLRDTDWPAAVAATGSFTPLVLAEVDNVQRDVDVDTVVARAVSTSYVAAGDDDLRDRVAREVRAIVEAFDEPFDYPYVTHLFTCHRA